MVGATALLALGIRESARANDVIVAIKPKSPPLPFSLANSVRLQDPTLPENVKKIRRAYEAAVKIMHEEQGFDFVSSVYLGNACELGLPKVLSNCEHNMDWFTAGVLKFLEAQQSSGKPFFLYYAPNVPHGGSRRFLENDPRATPEGLVDWHLGSQPARTRAGTLAAVADGALFIRTKEHLYRIGHSKP